MELEKAGDRSQDNGIQRFVAFDFDGTILDGHSPVMLVKSLFFTRIMPIHTVLAISWWAFRYKFRLPHEQEEVREKIFALFKDKSAVDANKMMEYLYETEISTHLRIDALAEMRAYQELGVPVVIVSASFEPIVARAATELGAFAQISTKMEIVDDCYTGNIGSCPVEAKEKAEAFRHYADSVAGPGNWALQAAYGDHHTDVYLLEMAEHPVAVCPDLKLKRIARQRGWDIVEWS